MKNTKVYFDAELNGFDDVIQKAEDLSKQFTQIGITYEQFREALSNVCLETRAWTSSKKDLEDKDKLDMLCFNKRMNVDKLRDAWNEHIEVKANSSSRKDVEDKDFEIQVL